VSICHVWSPRDRSLCDHLLRYHSFQSDQLSPVDVWLVMVKSAIGEGSVLFSLCLSVFVVIADRFSLVASRAMGAIHLCVFVRHDIIDCVSNVSTTYVPCGIGNVMYNKGAVGVRMNFYDTSVAFICAHLAANKEKVMRRPWTSSDSSSLCLCLTGPRKGSRFPSYRLSHDREPGEDCDPL
jgi:hypothetical protein